MQRTVLRNAADAERLAGHHFFSAYGEFATVAKRNQKLKEFDMNWIILIQAALSAALIIGCARTDSTDNNESESTALPQAENLIVHSADSTRIGFTKIGSGSIPVVIVHGALNTGQHWMRVAAAMGEHCTCYVMDRWGRGGSEHRTDYAFEREAEDIQAVLAQAGPDAYLLGHSSGAIYALEAGRDASIAGLILYEPPLFGGTEFEAILERIRVAANEERFDDAVSIFLREEGRIPKKQLSLLKETPVWETMVALAPQSVREWNHLVEAKLPVDRYQDITVPTLLLAGTETEDHPSFATHELEDTLPDARIAMLEGQGHSSHQAAPDLIAKEVTNFILETSQ